MKSFTVGFRTNIRVMIVLMAGLMCSPRIESAAVAADDAIHEAPAVISTDGLTIEQYAQIQKELHDVLSAEFPRAALDGGVHVELTAEELDSIVNPQQLFPLKNGVVRELDPVIEVAGLDMNDVNAPARIHDGVLAPSAGGGWVWSLVVSSTGADAIRAHIEQMSLPAGFELYFFNEGGEAYGPFMGTGPDNNGDMWTPSVVGETGILQLHIPANATANDWTNVRFDVTGIAHIDRSSVPGVPNETAFGSFCGNAICIEDATCFAEPIVAGAKDAIAMMEFISGGGSFLCSGGLLSDTNPTQDNYYLTANHCISTAGEASSCEFFWRFRTSICNGSCPNPNSWGLKNFGSTVKVTNATGDFTLLQLNANPPVGSVFLGWSTTAVAFSSGTQLYRISNPGGGPQVYSKHSVDTAFGACGGWPRGNWIYSRDTIGAIDGGSSGSPVINSSSQVVGQLSGACGSNPADVCANGPGEANATVDGAFANYFAQVQSFISPPNQPATITQHPVSQSACQNAFVSFTVTATGTGTITYQWKKNGSNIVGATANTLVISSAQPADAASYTCVATNSFGSDESDPGALTVLTNASCNDGLFCNGVETCSGGVCVDNANPCPEACKESNDTCQNYGTLSCDLLSAGAQIGGSATVEVNLSQVLDLVGYEAKLVVTRTSGAGDLTAACPSGVSIDNFRSDYVFLGQTNFPTTDCPNLRVAAAVFNPVEVPVGGKYLGTYQFDVSGDATVGTTFEISFATDPIDTFLRAPGIPEAIPIPFDFGPPCVLTIVECGVYGDVAQPQNGIVSIDDILCVINAFASPASCPLADIAPCFGNGIVNLDDILAVIGAFAGDDPCCGG